MLIVHVTNTDPAGAAYNLIRAINEHTLHRARLITTQTISGFDFPRDLHDLFDSGDEMDALLKAADVIHFHKVKEDFSFEFELENGVRKFNMADYVKGKKVVYHVHGSPYERNFPQENANEYIARKAVVLASTPDLEEIYRMMDANVTYFPNCVPINDVRYLPRATDKVLMGNDGKTERLCVFQSGTHSILKNMHVIREVTQKLQREGLPIFFLHTTPENIQTQDFALRHKRISHIVFDHIEGYYGLSSLEALSMGKPTIAGLSKYTIEAICKFFGLNDPNILPWQVARTPEMIEKTIRDLVNDAELRNKVGASGRKFMEEVWSDANVARGLADFYQSL